MHRPSAPSTAAVLSALCTVAVAVSIHTPPAAASLGAAPAQAWPTWIPMPPAPAPAATTAAPAVPAPGGPVPRPAGKPVVKERHPHLTDHYTQGFEYLGDGKILESTGGVGQSWIMRVDLKTGKAETKTTLPIGDAFGEGATNVDGTSYYLTWKHEKGVAFDTATLKEKSRFSYTGEGWGLTHDDRHLIMSDGSSKLTFRNPADFGAVKTVEVTTNGKAVTKLNELEYVDGAVYANIYQSPVIAKIDPATGKVLSSYDTTDLWKEARQKASDQGVTLGNGDVPNGIAYVPERKAFLLTGKRWPLVFEVTLD